MGTLAPSHTRAARSTNRRSGGVVMITYAAATPAVASAMFAAVRAPLSVTRQPRRVLPDEPVEPVPVDPPVPPGRVCSDELLRMLSDPLG